MFLPIHPANKSVLYLAAFYPENSGYHWRVYKWAEELRKQGYFVEILHALNQQEFKEYSKNPSRFMVFFLRKRFWQVVKARKFETVIVRRELLIFNDYGNLFLEKLLRKLCNHIILDFDDDLAASKQQPKKITSLYAKVMQENGNSFRESFNYYDKFIVASNYLKDYVLKYSSVASNKIMVIPTCVDYDKYPPKKYDTSKKQMTLGWIGGDHNYPLLQSIIPILNKLSESYSFDLLVIGGETFIADANFDVVFKKWSLETEVDDLLKIDIGLMPLSDSVVDKGKGGFKLIQYMGLGIVGLASAYTINLEIIDDKKDSFLIFEENDWYDVLSYLFSNAYLLDEISVNAQLKIKNQYTFSSNLNNYKTIICVE